MRAAKSLDDAVPAAGSQTTAKPTRPARPQQPGLPGGVDPIAPKSAPPAGAPVAQPMVIRGSRWTSGGLPSMAIGKAFFRDVKGDSYSCTAESIRSDTGNALLTSAHCVVDGATGNWYNWNYQTNTWGDWTFVPGYSDGSAPFGTWYANQLFSGAGYLESKGGGSSDVGAAVMNTLNGQHLADVVGAYGVQWNASRARAVTAFGYPATGNGDLPAASRYTGRYLIACSGTTYDSGGNVALGCDQGKGASGGAVIAEFSTNGGWITTVNSRGSYTDAAQTIQSFFFGPYFGSNMQNLWETIRGL